MYKITEDELRRIFYNDVVNHAFKNFIKDKGG